MAEVSIPVKYVNIRLSAHATEDTAKVERAFWNLFPDNKPTEISLNLNSTRGHYGNPITLFETQIEDPDLIKAFIERLADNLSEPDKIALGKDSRLIIEKRNLYLRLDKQALFNGRLKLCKADPIRIRIHFKEKKEKVIELCRNLGLML
ncbi:MAG: hypothetical protein JSV64_05790 [Candidatus Bathyarchaeota archaeon]|nr:MAG: hypothetical protein JSV64_05790 [Candidatus Bathyarchaeota archaeon]